MCDVTLTLHLPESQFFLIRTLSDPLSLSLSLSALSPAYSSVCSLLRFYLQSSSEAHRVSPATSCYTPPIATTASSPSR